MKDLCTLGAAAILTVALIALCGCSSLHHTEYYPDGGIFVTGQHVEVDGKRLRTGVWREYWPNGELRTQVTYALGQHVGAVVTFDEEGRLQSVASVSRDAQMSAAIRWYPNGRIALLTEYENGVANGMHFSWDDSGQVIARGQYRNDEAHGPWLTREDGQWISESFVDGKVFGTREVRDASGVLRLRGSSLADQPVGTWSWYYPDGSMQGETEFLAGRNHGRFRTWWPNGRQHLRGWMFMGEPSGDWRETSEDGRRETRAAYIYGRIYSGASFYVDGKLVCTERRPFLGIGTFKELRVNEVR